MLLLPGVHAYGTYRNSTLDYRTWFPAPGCPLLYSCSSALHQMRPTHTAYFSSRYLPHRRLDTKSKPSSLSNLLQLHACIKWMDENFRLDWFIKFVGIGSTDIHTGTWINAASFRFCSFSSWYKIAMFLVQNIQGVNVLAIPGSFHPDHGVATRYRTNRPISPGPPF